MLNWALRKLLLPLFLEFFLHQQIICLVILLGGYSPPTFTVTVDRLSAVEEVKLSILVFKNLNSCAYFMMCDETFLMPGEFCYQFLY